MSIVDFFDPLNKEHILAYRFLEKNGHWPRGFINDEMEIPPTWQMDLFVKMSRLWLEYFEAGKIQIENP